MDSYFQLSIARRSGWVRVCGVGFGWKSAAIPETFSQRHTWTLKIGQVRFFKLPSL